MMKFQDFIGNERVVTGLERAIVTDQIRHAYLFTGPTQVGKRTLAMTFAQAIQCTQRPGNSGDACGICYACLKVEHGNHPDLLTFAIPKDRQHYTIEQIRNLIEAVSLKATEGNRHIFVITEADKITLPGLQASLKILEEPPPDTMILLTCTSTDLLLPTIRSRCQEVSLAPVAPQILTNALMQRMNISADEAMAVALVSGGCPGWAIDAVNEPEELAERRATLRDLATITRASRSERITLAAKYATDKDHAQYTVELWLPWWRDVLLAAHGDKADIRHVDDRTTIEAEASRWGAEAAERVVRAQMISLEELDQNANPRLVFEILLQSLPGLS